MSIKSFTNVTFDNLEQFIESGGYPCDVCGDYEYCAGHYNDEECTGFIPN